MATRKYKRKFVKKGGHNSKRQKCLDTKCKLWLEDAAKTHLQVKRLFQEQYKAALEKEKKICNSNSKSSPECKRIKEEIMNTKRNLAEFEDPKNMAKTREIELASCKNFYCNEGCKDTIFENGAPDILPSELFKKYKNSKSMQNMLINQRKQLFDKKKSRFSATKKRTILIDDFYEDMPKTTIVKLKQEGAISGCTRT